MRTPLRPLPPELRKLINKELADLKDMKKKTTKYEITRKQIFWLTCIIIAWASMIWYVIENMRI